MPITSRYSGAESPNTLPRSTVRYQSPMTTSARRVTTDWIADAFGSSSDATSSSTKDDKVIRAARDDAASFVASNGAIRGAQLEAAFVAVRAQYPAARNVSDQELAAAILAP